MSGDAYMDMRLHLNKFISSQPSRVLRVFCSPPQKNIRLLKSERVEEEIWLKRATSLNTG